MAQLPDRSIAPLEFRELLGTELEVAGRLRLTTDEVVSITFRRLGKDLFGVPEPSPARCRMGATTQ